MSGLLGGIIKANATEYRGISERPACASGMGTPKCCGSTRGQGDGLWLAFDAQLIVLKRVSKVVDEGDEALSDNPCATSMPKVLAYIGKVWLKQLQQESVLKI